MKLQRIHPDKLREILAGQPQEYVDFMIHANSYLVWDDGKLIGMIGYGIADNRFIVQYLNIKADMRRQGWGLKVLKYLEEIAICNRCNEMFLIYKDKALEPFYDKAREIIPMLICEYKED